LLKTVPDYLKKRVPLGSTAEVRGLLDELDLTTVCQGAHCPNLAECFSQRTAAFMVLGSICTRNCRFCAIDSGLPQAPDTDEPGRIAEACRRLELDHVVVTSVTRDDLADGGAAHFAATIRAIHRLSGALVEVLTPDFAGRTELVDVVLAAEPEVFNHNVETVPRLYTIVRPQADFRRSLSVLAHAARTARSEASATKSGLMVGLGETADEVREVIGMLAGAGVVILSIGQYLAPSAQHLSVARYVRPEEYSEYEDFARAAGIPAVAAGPFIRSSYRAGQVYAGLPERAEARTVSE